MPGPIVNILNPVGRLKGRCEIICFGEGLADIATLVGTNMRMILQVDAQTLLHFRSVWHLDSIRITRPSAWDPSRDRLSRYLENINTRSSPTFWRSCRCRFPSLH